MKQTLVILVVVVVIVLAGALSAPGRELVARNWLSLEALKAAESGNAARMLQVIGELEEKAQERCAYSWQAGRLEQLRGNIAAAALNNRRILECSSFFIPFVQKIDPLNTELAKAAVLNYPSSANANYWLAETIAQSNKAEAVFQYEKVLAIDPHHGLAWCRLGRIREDQENLQGALLAFENCCKNGDPGVNGCVGAGHVYEKLGNIPSAIRAYRTSKWIVSQQRAEELERSLKP